MDFRQLESFVAIAKYKSFTRAAEELYLTQPTLTGHIQVLENELGTVLFNRCGRRITLTEAGRLLYNHAVNILNMREEALYSLASHKGKLAGELAIASSTVPQKYLLPRLLAAFSCRYPHIRYVVKQFDSKKVIDAIISGSMDFGFVGTGTYFPELEMLKLFEDRLILIASTKGKYANYPGDSVPWEEIKDEKFILREKGSATRKFFITALAQRGIEEKHLHVIAEMENPQTVIQCVREGLGLAIMSEKAVREEIELGLVQGFYISDLDLTREFYFITHKNRVLNPVTRAFQEFTRLYCTRVP
ncbi:MAG TPA: LysR family transcriptional regulator [Firmicutes bacterium]|jgi:DNA-binding transcriptional LysR family regulator|nr:LysR family transcriptional regulator [Bacillota bacterium]